MLTWTLPLTHCVAGPNAGRNSSRPLTMLKPVDLSNSITTQHLGHIALTSTPPNTMRKWHQRLPRHPNATCEQHQHARCLPPATSPDTQRHTPIVHNIWWPSTQLLETERLICRSVYFIGTNSHSIHLRVPHQPAYKRANPHVVNPVHVRRFSLIPSPSNKPSNILRLSP